MAQIRFGAAIDIATAKTVTSKHFGSVVKSGEQDNGSGGGYTNYGQTLTGVTHTTLSLDALGIGSIRYPGGSEAYNFSITDAADIAGLKRALDYCEIHNVTMNFTIDDSLYVNAANGVANITSWQRTALESFIRNDLLGYADSVGAVVESIHIGNEFSGRTEIYGAPAWQGYGNVSALLLNEINKIFSEYHSVTGHESPQIVIEPPNWTNNSQQAAFLNILKNTIDSTGGSAAGHLDSIDLHGNGSGSGSPTNTLDLTWGGYYGNADSLSYEARLQGIINYWTPDPATAHVDFRVDAWSYDTTGGPSLQNAALGMLQMHTFSELGIISATNYIGYGADGSALVFRNLNQFTTTVNLSAGGALFSMMQASLEGTEAINIAGAPTLADEATATSLTRTFAGGSNAILYIVNRETTDLAIDLVTTPLTNSMESFIGGVQTAAIDIMGSSSPTSKAGSSTHELNTIATSKLGAGEIDFTLNSYEIAQISLTAAGNFGNDLANTLNGTAGTNILHGLAGNDILKGLAGNDLLAGGAGNDQLFGGDGNDVLYGGAGADILEGEAGIDTASYAFSTMAVKVSLTVPTSNLGDAVGDSFVGIENITGGQFGDIIAGDALANLLVGGLGSDWLLGDAGADNLQGDAGNDTLDGGTGADTALYIDGVAATINLNLTTAQATGYGTDTLISIENLSTGSGNDRLSGNSLANRLSSGTGNDTLDGGVVDDFYLSTDPNGSTGQIFRLYQGVLDRNPDKTGFENWINWKESGQKNLLEVTSSFIGSVEFQNHYGSTTNAKFVTLLYSNVLDRSPDPTGLQTWVGALDTGTKTREQVVQGFTESTEFKIKSASVSNVYLGTLRDSDDTLWGGAGADLFVFGGEFGRDVVVDFDPLQIGERIDLRGVSTITSFADLQADHLTQSGGNAIISDGEGNSITLAGLYVSNLSSDNFLYS